jgi:hypothetical protein
MDALEDWLVEVEEVEVEAADKTARVEEGTGPRVDPQAFGAMRLTIPSKAEPVAHALLPTHAISRMANLQCSPVSHAQARVTREQDSSADSEPPLHSVLPPNRAVETLRACPARTRPSSRRDRGATEVVPRRRNPPRDPARGPDADAHIRGQDAPRSHARATSRTPQLVHEEPNCLGTKWC